MFIKNVYNVIYLYVPLIFGRYEYVAPIATVDTYRPSDLFSKLFMG